MTGLAVFFSEFVFRSELGSGFFFFGAVIIRIDGVYLGLEESYGI